MALFRLRPVDRESGFFLSTYRLERGRECPFWPFGWKDVCGTDDGSDENFQRMVQKIMEDERRARMRRKERPRYLAAYWLWAGDSHCPDLIVKPTSPR